MGQGAILGFAGDLAEPAQAAFATFLAQQHDHKAAVRCATPLRAEGARIRGY